MKKAFGIARTRAGRVGLVAGVAVAAVVGLALPAGANTGHVYASQSCADGWHVSVTLDNNVRLDHLVVVTTTIPGTTGLTGHYDTTHNSSTQQIWDAAGPAVASGQVTLTIYNPNGSVDSIASAWLPGVEGCHPTTTTSAPTTTTMQTTTTTCVTTTTMPPTTTTMAPTTTLAPTTTTMAPTTTVARTTTTLAPTTTVAPTTTMAPTTTIAPTTSTTSVAGTTVVVTSTTKPATTTTVKEQGSTVPTTAAPTTTRPAAGQTLPFTGSSTTYPVIFGLSCVAAGGLLLLRKRTDWSRP